jgi:hypothetical protein
MHRETLTFLMISLLTVVINGCAVPQKSLPLPDLVPSTSPGQDNITGFCKGVGKTVKVVVSVKNQGNAASPVSTTTVQFSPEGSFRLATPAIQPGGSANLEPLNIPPACFNPDCNFTITVDSDNQIKESNAKNNTTDGRCIGEARYT